MDIKRHRREVWTRCPDDYPGSGYGRGSAASDQNAYWWARAQSWSEGADVDSYKAIENENDGEHERWGTPYEDVLPVRAENNADDPLPNPCNFHSNPGYMGTSTASSLIQSAPGSGAYRTAGGGGHRPMPVGGPARAQTPGRTITPAGGARQPESEGGPLVVSTGFPGR